MLGQIRAWTGPVSLILWAASRASPSGLCLIQGHCHCLTLPSCTPDYPWLMELWSPQTWQKQPKFPKHWARMGCDPLRRSLNILHLPKPEDNWPRPRYMFLLLQETPVGYTCKQPFRFSAHPMIIFWCHNNGLYGFCSFLFSFLLFLIKGQMSSRLYSESKRSHSNIWAVLIQVIFCSNFQVKLLNWSWWCLHLTHRLHTPCVQAW